MKIVLIAMVAHSVNLAYCASLGDTSQPAWADAPESQQASAIAGVKMHLDNPDATPEQSHESWLAQKTAEGWAYGEVKDVEKKLHPCFLPYAELPAEQKAKDYLFRGVVHALKDIPDATVSAPAPKAVVVSANGKIPVRYVGKRETYVDGMFGTRIAFVKGESSLVPADKARLMFNHPDVYEPGEATGLQDDGAAVVDPKEKEKQQKEDEDQDMRDSVANMTKKALGAYAKTNFNVDLDQKESIANLRAKVTGLLDQYGAP